jgi:hypothetical protein
MTNREASKCCKCGSTVWTIEYERSGAVCSDCAAKTKPPTLLLEELRSSYWSTYAAKVRKQAEAEAQVKKREEDRLFEDCVLKCRSAARSGESYARVSRLPNAVQERLSKAGIVYESQSIASDACMLFGWAKEET